MNRLSIHDSLQYVLKPLVDTSFNHIDNQYFNVLGREERRRSGKLTADLAILPPCIIPFDILILEYSS